MSEIVPASAFPIGFEQGLWRLVHAAAAAAELSSQQLTELRLWAGERARAVPGSVIDHPRGVLRASFATALEIAAKSIAKGDVLEA